MSTPAAAPAGRSPGNGHAANVLAAFPPCCLPGTAAHPLPAPLPSNAAHPAPSNPHEAGAR